MGSLAGALKIAARRAGVALQTYVDRVAAGEKYCWRCQEWHAQTAFATDASRSDGRVSGCRESTNKAARDGYRPQPRASKLGAFYAAMRDGDKKQARARVNHHVENGLLPHPNTIPCTDCGHEYRAGERRHEYDHHLGYGAEHQLDVEVACTTCHRARGGT